MPDSDKFWDKAAEKYSRAKISDEASYQKKLHDTQKHLSADMHVLEIGCGTGSTAIQHAPHVKLIDAIDVSENMLEIGRARARDAGIENINFIRTNLSEFNAERESLDVVMGLNVLHLLPDWRNTIQEIARILKPDGIFVSSTACIGDSPLRFIKLITPLGKLLGIMPDVFVITESELAQETNNAGLKIQTQWNQGGVENKVFMMAKKHQAS